VPCGEPFILKANQECCVIAPALIGLGQKGLHQIAQVFKQMDDNRTTAYFQRIIKFMSQAGIHRYRYRGFTLAELLIALAILGVIATFTIPKLITGQQSGSYNAAAHETAAMISGAYQQYQTAGLASGSTTVGALTPYMNYVSTTNSGSIDVQETSTGSRACNSAGGLCLVLHNGGKLFYSNDSFGGTATTNGMYIFFDPDGTNADAATTTGPGKSLIFFLYYNGKLTSFANLISGTTSSAFTWGTCPGCDPSWFHW
jgi:prepilin-type N-terminal cleavage/methylation domain-containing protein